MKLTWYKFEGAPPKVLNQVVLNKLTQAEKRKIKKMKEKEISNKIIKSTIIGCSMCMLGGIAIGMGLSHVVNREAITHFYNCQEKALIDSVARLNDMVDIQINYSNDSLDIANAQKIRNHFKNK